MHVRHLTLGDFRSYPHADVVLEPGITTLVGLNGQGKTNLVEAIGYFATLGSHRVSTDAPLVRFGATQAIIRAAVVRDGRESIVELELNPGRANRARLNRATLTRPRDVLGTLRTVLFAPEDLALVKGDPGERRRFLDDLLVARQPRWAGVRADHDKLLKQRGTLLKQAQPLLRRGARRRPPREVEGVDEPERAESALHTLEVWNAQLAKIAAPLLYARLRLVHDLGPHLAQTYEEVSAGQSAARMSYRASVREEMAARIAGGEIPSIEELHDELLAAYDQARAQEIDRGQNLVGPHRDDLLLTLGELPAKGYASHGESWSFALGLKLAAYHLLRHDLRDDPVLILDDVFAELDVGRRERLAELVADCEQVLITAAVPADVPESLAGRSFTVTLGEVSAGE
ncbi:MAG: DNA replication/repair protein RecF [Dermatophilaceae bacterium]